MNKKWNGAIAILCASFLVFGCASGKEQSNAAPENKKKTEERKEEAYQSNLRLIQPKAYSNVDGLSLEPGDYISIIGKSAGGQYWDAVKKGAEQAGEDLNKALGYEGKDKVKVTYSGPTEGDNVDEQVNILDEELARYPISLSISIVDTKACEVQFDIAAESDIPIVAFDSGSDYQGLMSTVATDNVSTARAAADKLADRMDEQGEIALFVRDAKSKAAIERENAFVDQIKTQHPGIQIVNVYHMDQLQEMQQKVADEINAGTYKKGEAQASQTTGEEEKVDPKSITQEDVVDYIFAKNPNIRGCYGTNAESVMLAVNGIDRLEPDDRIAVVGFDADDAQIKALSAGKIDGLIVQNPFGMGYAAVVASARASMEIGNEAVVNTGYTWVTKRNLKDDAIQNILY